MQQRPSAKGPHLSSHMRQDLWSCPSSALYEEEEPAQAALAVALKEDYGSGQAGFDSKVEILQRLEAKVQQWKLVPGRVTAAG